MQQTPVEPREEVGVERWTHQVIGLPGLELVVLTLMVLGEYKVRLKLINIAQHCHWSVCLIYRYVIVWLDDGGRLA